MLFTGFAFCTSAQKVSGTVKGTLQDSTSATALTDATVSVIHLPDSSLISFTLTNSSGYFEIKNLDLGEYAVLSSFVGVRSFKKNFSISASHPVEDLGLVKLQRSDKMMEEVVITETPVKVSGDTISYKADAFKTKPNATVEDLLKKLPGVQVGRDGTVKAQGENVQKVYVDGKEFFNNDPKLATKNLTADMVDRVEVYDDMSEQAKFNGIDDGSRAKAINLKLKKDKKKGVFGKAYAGYGTDGRYNAGVTANYFKGATQANLIAKANNVNDVGYTLTDIIGLFGAGNMMNTGGSGGNSFGGSNNGGSGITMLNGTMTNRGGGSSTSVGGFNLGNTGGGITQSAQAGLNYRDTWSKLFDVNGSYFFNRTRTDNERTTLRQSFVNDTTTLINRNNTTTQSINNNHRANYNLIYTIDSFNSIIYQPNLNVQNSRSYSNDSLLNTVGSKTLNAGRSITDNTGSGYNWSNNLLWRKRFRKPGRTFSLNFSNTLADNDRTGYNFINTITRKADYMNRITSGTHNYGLSASYTEPLARDKVLEVNYSHNDNRGTSDRETFYNNGGKYDQLVDSLTNNFENKNLLDRIGTNFRVVKKKYNYQLGVAVQQTTLESDNLSKNTAPIVQKSINLFPTASFNYQFQRSRSLRINYRGRTNQPTVSQLQEVKNYDNFPYTYIGNAALKQEFTHNVMLSYNFFDIIHFRNLFAFVTYQATQSKIANAVYNNRTTGEQLTKPVNVNGVYNVNGNFNIGFPIKHLTGGNFNTNTRIGYNQDVTYVDNLKNFTRNLSAGEDLRLSYNYKEKLDLGATASVNYNQVKYSVQKQNNQSYFTHVYSGDATYTLPKNFILATDVDFTFNTGLAAGYNQNYAIWNASIAKQVFKNKRGEIKAYVFDILNQNTSVYRNVAQNYIEDVRNLVLKRYFMLTFTLNINRMGGRSMPPMMERAARGFRLN